VEGMLTSLLHVAKDVTKQWYTTINNI
jgi:hypothetical protein